MWLMRTYEEKREVLVSIEKSAAAMGIAEAELNRRLDAGLPHIEAYGHRWLSKASLDVMMEAVE